MGKSLAATSPYQGELFGDTSDRPASIPQNPVHKKVHAIIAALGSKEYQKGEEKVHVLFPNKSYKQTILINGKTWDFQIPKNTEQSNGIVFNENDELVSLQFSIKETEGEKRKYVFRVGIGKCLLVDTINAADPNDELRKHLASLSIRYIQQIEAKAKGGSRYKNGNGENIVRFDYFGYIFGTHAHEQIFSTLKDGICQILINR